MDNPRHIIVPLMAICEAGLRFPLHPFLRELLRRYNLTRHYFAINSYRIVMPIIAFKELHNLTFKVANLFACYTMSRHGESNRRYLSSQRGERHLITNLLDTDKWENLYVEVHGNYEFGDSLNRKHEVPKVTDFRGL